MKILIKNILKVTGKIINSMLDFPILELVADSFMESKISMKRKISLNGHQIYLHTPNFLLRYRHKTFFSKEPETLEWIDGFEENSIFYDIGANVGLYSIYAAKIRKTNVFAFEPSFFNLEFLARNVYSNSLTKNISIIPIALNDKISLSKFNISKVTWGGALSTFERNFDDDGNEMNIDFEYNTLGFDLDSFLKLNLIPPPDYIKIDVDGLEHFILEGGKKTLRNVKSILIEINDNFEEQREFSERIMKLSGFRLVRKVHAEIDEIPTFNQVWVNNND